MQFNLWIVRIMHFKKMFCEGRSDEKMIFKAKDLIKKEQVFQVEGDTYTNLKLACEKVAYSAFLKRNIQMSTNLNRLVRLTNRLEREFLRGRSNE